ncbi:MAG: hypothetical protein M1831_003451 [Alyxoria varia]|nr:MAG: hypothetical protein M1831_003451 [Alyxoria varia]
MANSSPPSRQPPRVTVAGDVAATNATASAFLGPRRHSWMNAPNVTTNPHIQHYLNPSNLRQGRPHMRVDVPLSGLHPQAAQSISHPQSAPLATSPSRGNPIRATLPSASNPPATNPYIGPVTTNVAPPTLNPQNPLPSPALSAEAPPDQSFEKNANEPIECVPQSREQAISRPATTAPVPQQAPNGAESMGSHRTRENVAASAQFESLSAIQAAGHSAHGSLHQPQFPAQVYNRSHQSVTNQSQQPPSRTLLSSGRRSIGNASGDWGVTGQQGTEQAPARVPSSPSNGYQVHQSHRTNVLILPRGPFLERTIGSSSAQEPETNSRTIEGVGMDAIRHGLSLCLDRIRDAYVDNGNGPRRELWPSEQLRIKILRGAIAELDLYYIIVHQFAHTLYEDSLPPALRDIQHIRATRYELFHIFNYGTNSVSSEFAAQIANFPPPGFFPSSVLVDFQNFATRYPLVWPQLRLECQERGYPALVDEIAGSLRVISMQLSGHLFIASMLCCWGRDEVERVQTPAWQFHGECWKVVIKYFQGKASNAELADMRQRNVHGLRAFGDAFRAYQAQRKQRRTGSTQIASTITGPQVAQQPTMNHPPYAGETGGVVPRPLTLSSNNVQQSYHAAPNQANSPYNVSQPNPLSAQGGLSGGIPNSAAVDSTATHNNAVISNPQAEAPKLSQPLIPPEDVHGLQVAPPDPDRWAAHQAYLRSPLLEPRLLDGQVPTEPTYLYVSGFILAPQPHKHGAAIQEWHFDVSDDLFDRLTETIDSNYPVKSRSRSMSPSMQILRLRFVRELDDQIIDDLNSWAAGECIWPSGLFFMLNDEGLDPRKKLHWGRDMHIDVTKLVARGENKINLYCMHGRDAQPIIKARIGVESVKLALHSSITEEVTSRVWPADEVQARIRNMLEGTEAEDDDDDEIMCISSTLQVSLLDPILSRVWTIPVRGKSCRHFEVFDLETFLNTRPRQGESQTASADHWRCPICNADARPDALFVDGWLQSVKDKLEIQRLWSNVKAVVVKVDGSWTIKEGNANRNSKRPGTITADTDTRASVSPTGDDTENENPPSVIANGASGGDRRKPQEKQSDAAGGGAQAPRLSPAEPQPQHQQTTSEEQERSSSGEPALTSLRDSVGFVDIDIIDTESD